MISLPPFMKPMRWLAHLPLAILPFLAAAVVEGPRLPVAVAQGVKQNLAGAGLGWAKVETAGRDVIILGIAPDRQSADAALWIAGRSPGVRRVVHRYGIVP